MKELRVAIFTGNYNHIADGVSLTLNRLVRYLEKKNIPVIVFGPTSNNPDIDHAGEFIPVPSVPLPGRPEYRVTVGFPEEVQKKLRAFKPTLIHIATPDLLGFRAMRFAQAHDIQIVASYHTHFTSYLKYYNMDMLEMLGWKYLVWFYEQCKHVYVPAPSMADELYERGITNGLRIWSRGVDSTLFSPEKRNMQWRHALGIRDDEVIVTFVSRLVWEKDLQTMIDTFKKVFKADHNIRALIVGDGPAKKELEYLIKDGIFTGFLQGEDLARAYASSDIFFFPSDTETFGSVTLEALASGVPAVVADATGSKSLVESGVNGLLVPPKKTTEFAKTIVKLARNLDLRKKMSEAARQKALAYSWDTVMEKLVKNYEEALRQPRPELKF
ncbi:MAG TPA: glycosyltransferase family 1 protein [Balneolales bacterium]|nr:glycosyltransferase family 1 protein [Balneolales bacterium]